MIEHIGSAPVPFACTETFADDPFTRAAVSGLVETTLHNIALTGAIGFGEVALGNELISHITFHNADAIDLTLQTASDEQRLLLQKANRSAQRAADIVDQLMVYAHHGKPTAREPVNIYKVAEEVVNICRNTFDRKIAISLEASSQLTTLGHAGDLQQILLNLCINARDALEEAALETPELHIRLDKVKIDTPPDDSATPGGHFVRIDLSDNGVGMDAQTQSHIFDPFFTTKEVGKGTGLGLSTTYSIVHQHNGWIQCRSTLGQGTTFTLFLPLALPTPSAIKKEQEKEQQPRQGGKETILLVDDEEGVRRAVSILLEQGSLWIPGSCSKNAFNEEFQERFAPFSHVVHEFKKAQIEREFFL